MSGNWWADAPLADDGPAYAGESIKTSDDAWWAAAPLAEAESPQAEPFFSLGRAKETALGVARMLPGLGDLGREDAPPKVNSVLNLAPPTPDLPTTSKAPVAPAMRKRLEASWDGFNAEQRAAMESAGGWTGQLARERAGAYGRADAGAMAKPAARMIDSRAEVVRAEKSADPGRARRVELQEAAAQTRSAKEFAVDTYSALGQGLITVPQLVANVVAPDSPLAERLRSEMKAVKSHESDIMGARAALMADSVKGQEDFAGKYAETAYQLIANPSLGLQEFVRQAPMIAAMIGSGGTGAVAGRAAVGIAGRASPAIAIADAITGGAIAGRAAGIGATAGGVAASSVMSAGDAAGSTYDRLMDAKETPESVLIKNPDYRYLIDEKGLSPAQARREVAVSKSRMAAAMAAPLGVLGFAGAEASLVRRLTGQHERFGVKQAAKMMAKDNLGEQAEEGLTQLASNSAVATVDPSQKYLDGVPDAMATAAVTSAPFSAATAAGQSMASAQEWLGRGTAPTAVGDALRSLPTHSGAISPAATSLSAAQAERARLEAMRAARVQAQAAVDALRGQAVADIGAQTSVDGAIAAATRAVNIDSNQLLADALGSVGIDLSELQQADAADAAAQAAAQAMAQAPSAPSAQAAPAAPVAEDAPLASALVNQTVQPGGLEAPVRTWSGRRGDGYATPEDAERGLKERMRLQPNLDWRMEPTPDGRYRLAGYAAAQAQPMSAEPGPAERAAPMDLSVQEMEQGDGQPVLQNRDRTSAASVALMNSIAARPDYMRAGPSREMQTGSPVVVGDVPASAVAGRSETVVDGRGDRVQAQYMVVEAPSLLASNRADGTPNTGYAEGAPGALRAVAGNGRTAGLQAAYERGTAGAYRQELQADAQALGLDADAVAAMQAPVLVRVMRAEDVKRDMGDRTNIASTQDMSALEQAGNDAKRINVARLQFDEHGDPTPESVRAFVYSTPVSERGKMQNPDGSHTRQAVDRLMAATFKQAYASDDLVRLYAQATDPEARAVLAALADAAGAMAGMASAGDLDIRQAVADAAKMAVNATRRGLKLADLVQNADLDMSPEAFVVAQFLADNIRSAKRMGDGLRAWAQFAAEQARIAQDNTTQDGFFGDQPTVTREQLFQLIGQQDIPGAAQPARFADAAGRAERQGADSAAAAPGAADRGLFTDAQAASEVAPQRAAGGAVDFDKNQPAAPATQALSAINLAANGGQTEALELAAQTPADIEARQAEQEQAAKNEAAHKRTDSAVAQADDERKRIAQASVAAADSFELGQDALDSLTGQGSLLDARANTEVATDRERDLRAGAASVKDQTQTLAFKLWFGDSKAVDAEGKPLVMYHGTSATQNGEAFTLFDTYASNYGLMGAGAYFTDNPAVASSYTSKGKGHAPTVYQVYLSIKNPLDMEAQANTALWARQFPDAEPHLDGGSTNEHWYRAAEEAAADQGWPKWEGAEFMQDGLRAMGFDGIAHIGGGRVKTDEVRHRVYIAFDPEQIKSATGNNGNFDAASPDIQFSFAGEKATTADTMALTTAQERLTTGEDAEAVRKDTGWHKAADGKWRFEISDGDAKLKDRAQWTAALDGVKAKRDTALRNKFAAEEARSAFLRARGESPSRISADTKKTPEFKELAKALKNAEAAADKAQDGAFSAERGGSLITVGDVLEHPALFAAYPGIAGVRVDINNSLPANNAAYAYELRAIELSGQSNPEEMLSTLLHEIQHGIQHIEGFAMGGSMDTVVKLDVETKAKIAAVEKELRQAIAYKESGDWLWEDSSIDEIISQSGEPKAIKDWAIGVAKGGVEAINAFFASTPWGQYRRLAGETEARNTQARQKMTDAERRATPPSQTADVADSDVIVVFNGKEMRSAPVPVNAGGGAMSPELARVILALARPAPATTESVHKAVRELVNGLGLLPNSLGRIVVATSAEIKQDWEPLIGPTGMEASGDAGKAQGFYDPKSKTVFLIADNIKAGDELGVVAHELMHKHGPAVLGKEGWNQLHGAIGGWAKAKPGSMERIVHDEAARRVQASGPELSNQELFPYAVQVALEMGVRPNAVAPQGTVARWLAQVRSALRQVWDKIAGGKGDFNSLDLVNLAFGIAQRENPAHAVELDNAIEEERDEGAAKYQTQTEAFKRWFSQDGIENGDGEPQVFIHVGGKDLGVIDANKGDFGGIFVLQEHHSGGADRYGSQKYRLAMRGQIATSSDLSDFARDNPDVAAKILGHEKDSDDYYDALDVVIDESVSDENAHLVGGIDAPDGFAKMQKRRGALARALGVTAVSIQDEFGANAILVVHSNNVKDLERNNGQFDPSNADIRFSRSRVPAPTQGASFTLPGETRAMHVRRRMQDYFIRVQQVQKAVLEQGGMLDEQTNTYDAEELSHGSTTELLMDFARDVVDPLVKKSIKLGVEMDELSLFAYAMHAPERNAQIASIDPQMPDGGSGMTNAQAQAIIDQARQDGKLGDLQDLHADLMAITQTNRLVMLDEGLITQTEFDALNGAYQNYIPLRGFEVVDEAGKRTGRSAGKGFNIRGAETLRAKGRTSRAGLLIENAIADYQRTVVRAERNQVAKVFLNFAMKNPDSSLWEIDAITTRKSIDRKTGRIARTTEIDKGEDTIVVKINGVEIYIRIKDQLLLRAMKKSHSDDTGENERFLIRSASLYTTLLRNTLTRWNPEFAVSNALRDFGFGSVAMLDVLGEVGVAKFVGHYKGALAVSARHERNKLDPQARVWDKWFSEYKAAGGMTAGFYAKGAEDVSKEIRQMLLAAGATPKDWKERLVANKPARAVQAALRVLEFAGATSENAARVAAYRTAREMGKTPSQAASIAKNLTTNFDRKGELGQLTNSFYVFFNAAVQGSHKTLKMLADKKVMGYMAGVTAASVGIALASALQGGDDPDDDMAYWDKIPGYVKERNFIVMLPPGTQMEGAEEVGSKGRYIAIPVQYGLNIFHVLGYQIADVIRNLQDKTRGSTPARAGITMASAVAGSFNPLGGAVDLSNGSSIAQAILPSLFDPVVQLTTGTNGFGRNVAPFKSSFDTAPDSNNANVRQEGGTYHRVAQWINAATGGDEHEPGAIDVSPGTLENVVRNLTGGAGPFVYDALSLAAKSVERAGGGDPDLFVRDIPMLRKVYGETAGDVDQGLFYERRKAIEEARGIQKRRDDAGLDMTDSEKEAKAGLSKDASKYTKWLSDTRKEMVEVKKDTEMSDLEKRVRLRELRAERDTLTSEFNRSWMEAMKEWAAQKSN